MPAQNYKNKSGVTQVINNCLLFRTFHRMKFLRHRVAKRTIIYALSEAELKALKSYIDVNIANGFIRRLFSSSKTMTAACAYASITAP